MPDADAAGPAEIVFLDRETLSPETRLRAPDFPHRLTVHDRSTADEVATRIARMASLPPYMTVA